MKKIYIICIFLACVCSIKAVKVSPGPATIIQGDGTELTVIGHGDENFHYYTTTDGVLLYHKGHDYFIAGINDYGELVCTAQLAHELSERMAAEVELIEAQDKSKFFAFANGQATMAKAAGTASAVNGSTLFPHTGSPRVLVILAEFSDVKFTVNNPEEAFGQYFNKEGHAVFTDYGNYDTYNEGSVRQYFTDMSFGAFTPEFDIVGPITLDNTLAYYGAGDDYMERFIPDVCNAVDADVDFSKYDQDNDGYADLIYVIYAGYSASWNGNSTDCIWPKSGTLINGGTYDGVTVFRYGVSNELNYTPEKEKTCINGIGLFCHEFSHCMGMPDLYVTAETETQYADNQQMEYWSIMDYGTYLKDGYCPAAYTAWEREFFGWYGIETLHEAAAVELKTIDNEGKAYRIINDNNSTGNEYYIVENIQQKGWNGYQLGHGMLAIHVDYDENAFSLGDNSVNNTLGHPRMTVLAADGLLLNSWNATSISDIKEESAGDPFPGTDGIHELTDATEVKPVVYTGSSLNKPIYDIQEDTSTGIITFKFLDPDVTGIKDAIIEKEYKDNRVYTLDGRYAGTKTESLGKGLYIINNKKVVVR